jgi:DNA-binding response OmpR family regulator
MGDAQLVSEDGRTLDESEWRFDGPDGLERFCRLFDERLEMIEFWLIEATTSAEETEDPNVPSDLLRMGDGLRSLRAVRAEINSWSDEGSRSRERLRTLEGEMQSWISLLLGYAEMVALSARKSDVRDLLVPVRTVCAEGQVLLRLIRQFVVSRIGALTVEGDGKAPFFVRVDQERVVSDSGEVVSARSGHILVVDSDRTSRRYLTQWLSLEDFAVTAVSNPEEGSRLVGLGDFDLCLIDLTVMGSGGLELLEQIKGAERTQRMPVIIIFENQTREILARCLELGADDFLFKPLHPGVLQLRIQGCLERVQAVTKVSGLQKELSEEQRKYKNVLQVVLTDEILAQIKEGEEIQPRASSNCAVLFCRLVGDVKSDISSTTQHKLEMHQQVTLFFYDIMARYGMNHLRTVGDTFLAVAGLGRVTGNPVHTALRCALEMKKSLGHHVAGWNVEVGIHMGPLMVGFMGEEPRLYSMAADTVNMAARISAVCGKDSIAMSRSAAVQVQDSCLLERLDPKGPNQTGPLDFYRLIRFKTEEDLREEVPDQVKSVPDSKVG